MSAVVYRLIDMVQRDDNVKAVVLEVDTPGGGVTPSDEIRHRIEELKKAKKDKNPNFVVAVSMGSLATSGGYYVSAATDQIFAQPTTLTGNIGVLMPRFNLSALVEKIGVSEKTLTAPEGGFKNAGSMFAPDNPRDSKYLQGIIDQAYTRFRDIVKNGRGSKLKGDLAQIADGRVFTADEALKNGLIDQQGYLEDAYTWAAAQAGLSDPMVVKYHRRATLMEMMMSRSSGPEPKAGSVNVSVDAKVIDELMAPRLMYLWRGE
jgi:protease-4